MRRRSTALAIAAAALLAIPAAASAADPGRVANPARAIIVFDENTQTLAKFPRAKCRVTGSGGARKFKAKARDDGWKLEVRANDFSGFHDYNIEYGIRRTNFTITPPGNNGFFANFFFPGDNPPENGGALTFGRGGKTMGLGFIAAFASRGEEAVGVVGHAKCR